MYLISKVINNEKAFKAMEPLNKDPYWEKKAQSVYSKYYS